MVEGATLKAFLASIFKWVGVTKGQIATTHTTRTTLQTTEITITTHSMALLEAGSIILVPVTTMT